MAKIEFPKSSISIARLPSWIAPVVFVFALIVVVASMLFVITFIATAVSDASLVPNPTAPDLILNTKQLSRIGPRLGLDNVESKSGSSDVAPGGESEEELVGSIETDPKLLGDEALAPDASSVVVPTEGP